MTTRHVFPLGATVALVSALAGCGQHGALTRPAIPAGATVPIGGWAAGKLPPGGAPAEACELYARLVMDNGPETYESGAWAWSDPICVKQAGGGIELPLASRVVLTTKTRAHDLLSLELSPGKHVDWSVRGRVCGGERKEDILAEPPAKHGEDSLSRCWWNERWIAGFPFAIELTTRGYEQISGVPQPSVRALASGARPAQVADFLDGVDAEVNGVSIALWRTATAGTVRDKAVRRFRLATAAQGSTLHGALADGSAVLLPGTLVSTRDNKAPMDAPVSLRLTPKGVDAPLAQSSAEKKLNERVASLLWSAANTLITKDEAIAAYRPILCHLAGASAPPPEPLGKKLACDAESDLQKVSKKTIELFELLRRVESLGEVLIALERAASLAEDVDHLKSLAEVAAKQLKKDLRAVSKASGDERAEAAYRVGTSFATPIEKVFSEYAANKAPGPGQVAMDAKLDDRVQTYLFALWHAVPYQPARVQASTGRRIQTELTAESLIPSIQVVGARINLRGPYWPSLGASFGLTGARESKVRRDGTCKQDNASYPGEDECLTRSGFRLIPSFNLAIGSLSAGAGFALLDNPGNAKQSFRFLLGLDVVKLITGDSAAAVNDRD